MCLLRRNMPNKKLFHFTFFQKNNNKKEEIFHNVEDENLVLMGAYSTTSSNGALYIDCEPIYNENAEWAYPIQKENVLTIEQVYSASQNGNVLEIE